MVVVWVASFLGLRWLVRARRDAAVLRRPWPSVALVAGALVVALAVHPAADDRRSTGGGSDADDAVLVVLDGLRTSTPDPYATDTYLGNPPATGPGSVVWFAPFGTRSTYALGLVLAVVLLAVGLRAATGAWVVPSVVAGIVALSAPFWEAVAQGSDHLPFACGLAVAAAFVDRRRARPLGVPEAAMAGLALGLLSTSRAAFLHVPVLAGLALWRRDRRAALVLAGAGTAMVVALHGALIVRVGWHEYTPIQQLFVKSDEDLSTLGRLLVAAAVVTGGALAVALVRRSVGAVEVLLAGVGVPMTAIALAGLLTAGSPSEWSAGSYFLATVPLTALWVARRPSG